MSENLIQPATVAPVAPSREGIKERMLNLFAPGGEMGAVNAADEACVSLMIRDFLSGREAASAIDVKSLAGQFADHHCPLEPQDFADYLDYLGEHVIAHSSRTSSPRFIGHMTSALPCFMRPLSRLLTALNQNPVKVETAKSFSFYERQAIAMVHDLIFNLSEDFYAQHIQHAESTLGMVTSGGTIGNITALWCARNSCLGPRDEFAGVEQEGLAAALNHYGYAGAVVIGSSLMHYSFDKAVSTLGLGARGLVRVPVDRDHRIDLAELERTIADCRARNLRLISIVGIAGTTDSGAVDPLPELAAIARRSDAHFHVDAAWGGPLLFSHEHRHRLTGIEEADSVTMDGHKQMYLPMGIGLLMLRDPQLAKVIEKQARYIVRKGSYDLGRRSLEGSRPGMALFLHTALNVIGSKGYEFLIDENIRKTQYLASLIRLRPQFQLLIEPMMNILTYRYIPETLRERAARGELGVADNELINRFNERLQKHQRQIGQSFVSRTTFHMDHPDGPRPVVALRCVIANPLTDESDLEGVLNHQLRIATELDSKI